MKSRFTLVFLVLLSFYACKKEEQSALGSQGYELLVPSSLGAIDFPSDNEFTPARWALGKRLFYDSQLSADGMVSCASCHKPEKAFADDLAFSPGSEGAAGLRNVPSLANVAYLPYFTREGGVPTLEMHVLVPIQESNEFNSNIVAIAEALSQDPSYVQMSQAAYGQNPNPFVITRALANFQRSILSGNSAYDRFLMGDESALTESALAGMDLFFGDELKCGQCHNGQDLSTHGFENNGLYAVYPDSGKFRLSHESADIGKFKIPSLRNLGYTAPYMHDGSLTSLEEVINHYANGGSNHPNKSDLISGFEISQLEQQQVIDFLLALNDTSFIENPDLQP